MNSKESAKRLRETQETNEEKIYNFSPGITKRLLEKYKPTMELKVLDGGKSEEEAERAA